MNLPVYLQKRLFLGFEHFFYLRSFLALCYFVGRAILFVKEFMLTAVFICSNLNVFFICYLSFFAKPRLSDVRCVYSNNTIAICLRRLSVSFLFLVSAVRKKKRNQKKKDRWCKLPTLYRTKVAKNDGNLFSNFVSAKFVNRRLCFGAVGGDFKP